MDKQPLVSVCVICYNSSDTVLETLESIKNQAYDNLELIISDDGSKDKTIEVCKQWIAINKQRFVDVTVVDSKVNTGQSANYNRAVKNAKGEWVKTIDGDDILTPMCIEDLVNYAEHHNSDIVFSRMRPFGATVDKGVVACKDLSHVFESLNEKERLIILTRINYLPSPGSFIRSDLFKRIGYFDESIPFLEDWPFWVKAMKNGCKIDYLNKETVDYRIHGESVSQKKSTRISELFRDSRKKAAKYAYEAGSELGFFEWCYYSTLLLSVANRPTAYKVTRLLNLFNPFTYKIILLRRKFNKLLNN